MDWGGGGAEWVVHVGGVFQPLAAAAALALVPTSGSPPFHLPSPSLLLLLPFQMCESNTYTQSVDIYSFAIVMWEILTEEQPFKGCTVSCSSVHAVVSVGDKLLRVWVRCAARAPHPSPQTHLIRISRHCVDPFLPPHLMLWRPP